MRATLRRLGAPTRHPIGHSKARRHERRSLGELVASRSRKPQTPIVVDHERSRFLSLPECQKTNNPQDVR